MSLISLPLFKTNNTEKLEVADAYDIENTRPINKVYNAAKDGAVKLFDRAGGVRGISNSMQTLIQMRASGVKGKALLEAGLGAFGTSTMGILASAGNGILDKAGAFLDIDPSTIEKAKGIGQDVAGKINYGNLDDISSYGNLMTLIGDMAGYPEYADYINIGMESAVWGAAISQTIEYGQNNYMADVKQYIDPEVYHQAMVYSIPAVAVSGSLEAVQELNKQLGAAEILGNKGDFIQAFLQRFKMPDPRPADNAAYANELMTELGKLDPRWYLYSRAGEDIVDLRPLSTASYDARFLMELYTPLTVAMQLAPHYPEIGAEEVMREQFPLMVTTLS